MKFKTDGMMFLNRHPLSVILCSTAIVGLFSIPYMLNFQVEENVFELWLPQDQEYYKNGKWIENNFPSNEKIIHIMFEAKNQSITTTSNLNDVMDTLSEIDRLFKQHEVQRYPICTKIWSSVTNGSGCLEQLLFNNLTNIILEDSSKSNLINGSINVFLNLFYKYRFRAATFGTLENITNVNNGNTSYIPDILCNVKVLDITIGLEMSPKINESLENPSIEQLFLILMKNISILNEDMEIHYLVPSEIQTHINDHIFEDLYLLIGGFVLVLCYVITIIGKFNSVEHKLYISILGIIAIAYGAGVSIGFCQLIGWKFGSIHYLLPFLFLGIGIDDIFVITQALESVQKNEKYTK